MFPSHGTHKILTIVYPQKNENLRDDGTCRKRLPDNAKPRHSDQKQ